MNGVMIVNRFSSKSLSRLHTVDSSLIAIAEKALSISKIDFGIPEYGGYRTTSEQKELYERGASKCDGIRIKSKHQTKRALDVYAYVDGKASWDEYHLAMVACAMLQAASELGYKLEWGGLWTSFVDMPHFQLGD